MNIKQHSIMNAGKRFQGKWFNWTSSTENEAQFLRDHI